MNYSLFSLVYPNRFEYQVITLFLSIEFTLSQEKYRAAVPTAKLKKGRLQLSSATEGASINYRVVSASGEKGNWQIYVSPVQLKAGEKVEAVAARIGYKDSEVYCQE